MLKTTNLKPVLASVAVALLIQGWANTSRGAQAGKNAETIVITVNLPADAVLVIDGHIMQATGGVRVFETPPLFLGYKYAYTLKAKSQGKEVTREISVAHGVDNTFDLRDGFVQAAAKTKQAKKVTTPAIQGTPIYYSTINWGAALHTIEQALDTQPADGSRFPK